MNNIKVKIMNAVDEILQHGRLYDKLKRKHSVIYTQAIGTVYSGVDGRMIDDVREDVYKIMRGIKD